MNLEPVVEWSKPWKFLKCRDHVEPSSACECEVPKNKSCNVVLGNGHKTISSCPALITMVTGALGLVLVPGCKVEWNVWGEARKGCVSLLLFLFKLMCIFIGVNLLYISLLRSNTDQTVYFIATENFTLLYFYIIVYCDKWITATTLIIKQASVLPGCLPEDSATVYRHEFISSTTEKDDLSQLLEKSISEIQRSKLTDQALELKDDVT